MKLKPRNLRTLGLATALLALLTLSLRRLARKPFDARHHPLARPLTAHIDVAVVGVAHEAMAALLQFLVQHVQHQVRQQRRERSALRRAFLRRTDQAHPSSTPAVRKPRISFRMRLSATRLATSPIRMSWLTRSKNFSRSMSTTNRCPDAMYACACSTA